MFFRSIVPLALSLLLASCSTTLKTEHTPGTSLVGKKVFYVERHPEEDWGYHQMIADEMCMMGYTASAGEPFKAPANAEAIVTYNDKWYWDLSPYLLELELRVLDPKTRSLIAKTRNRRTSLARRNPKTMAQEALRSTFGLPKKFTVWVPSQE